LVQLKLRWLFQLGLHNQLVKLWLKLSLMRQLIVWLRLILKLKLMLRLEQLMQMQILMV